MTQKEKQLLLVDLCARLPYGVECKDDYAQIEGKLCQIGTNYDMCLLSDEYGESKWAYIPNCKPYLFPLSSMKEKQREELYKIGWYLDEDKIYSCFRNYDDANYKTHIDSFELINWCYKNNFDINGLIPMGLANDATGLNIY